MLTGAEAVVPIPGLLAMDAYRHPVDVAAVEGALAKMVIKSLNCCHICYRWMAANPESWIDSSF
jgi:hypothetical protein